MALGDINAMANISQQTRNQRDSFSQDTLLGANRSSHLLFANNLTIAGNGIVAIEGEEINEKANVTLLQNYVAIRGNPDFIDGDNVDYTGTATMMNSVSTANDGPSLKGPNLIVPAIDANGETIVPDSRVEPVVSPVTGRGFGVNLDRHSPGNSPTIGSYLERRRNEEGEIQVPKGEYVDETKYNWEA